jgi:uncharacterized protein (UPF0276 family)
MFGIGFKHAHYAELLTNPSQYKGNVVGAGVDFLEVHSENFFTKEIRGGGAARATLVKARQHWPISLHGVGLALGSAVGLDPWHLDQLTDLVERTDPILVSDHACFARGFRSHQLGKSAEAIHASDLLPIPFSKAALGVLRGNVNQVQERLQRPIAVENLSAYFAWNTSDYSETEFLAELAQRTGCKLLVDVNNIYVNALNAIKAGANIDPLQSCISWLDQIPNDVVAEIHVAGHNAMDDIVIDDHSCAVNESVWMLYRHASRRFGQVQALVEWDTDVPPLHVLIEQVQLAKQHAQKALA